MKTNASRTTIIIICLDWTSIYLRSNQSHPYRLSKLPSLDFRFCIKQLVYNWLLSADLSAYQFASLTYLLALSSTPVGHVAIPQSFTETRILAEWPLKVHRTLLVYFFDIDFWVLVPLNLRLLIFDFIGCGFFLFFVLLQIVELLPDYKTVTTLTMGVVLCLLRTGGFETETRFSIFVVEFRILLVESFVKVMQ